MEYTIIIYYCFVVSNRQAPLAYLDVASTAVYVAARPPVAAVTPDCVDIVCILTPSLFHLSSSHQPPVLYCLIRCKEKMASKGPKICTGFFT